MRRLNRKCIYFVLLSVLLLAACSSKEEVGLEEPEDDKDTIEEPDENPEPELAYMYPLSGEKTNEDTSYRAFGVMIENSAQARPQSGIYQADVVYEVLAEGTITRLLAFYHSMQPEIIGPVRSARDYYIYLNNGFDAVYASAGGSPGAFDLINAGYVDHISGLVYDGSYFVRSSERKAPHNLYTSYADLVNAATELGYDLTRSVPDQLLFAEEGELSDGEELLSFEVKYGNAANNVQYRYDEESGSYYRYYDGVRMDDLETGEPVAPDNVFIVEAPHQVIDEQQRRAIDVDAGGRAYLMQDGKVQEVEWKNDDGMILPYKDGKRLPYLPGQTWINLVPSGNGGLDNYVEFFRDTAEG
ncbi:Protein of unknown function [Evansella caseinilytica]|uniref:DUF3048 family protein n=1 Tax=Evansella caseinilytica TaxID=1503961 RepID=A0A1H3G2G6_9BACI|nr:DUF3048 domain-containing protein [Evansella caseinilytica]SDX96898.1 Protein of unknown function [Evansella caseinilytica]